MLLYVTVKVPVLQIDLVQYEKRYCSDDELLILEVIKSTSEKDMTKLTSCVHIKDLIGNMFLIKKIDWQI